MIERNVSQHATSPFILLLVTKVRHTLFSDLQYPSNHYSMEHTLGAYFYFMLDQSI